MKRLFAAIFLLAAATFAACREDPTELFQVDRIQNRTK